MSAMIVAAPLDCGFGDTECYAAVAGYPLLKAIASGIWFLDRLLLLLAYETLQLRMMLLDDVLDGALRGLAELIAPAFAPAATIAVILGCLLFLAAPLLGRLELINIRQAIVWAALAPLALANSGGVLKDLEQARWEVAGAVGAAAQRSVAPTAAAGTARDMAPVQAIYGPGAAQCPTPRSRPGGVRLDDLAAALLFADATDIHCPGAVSGQDSGLPRRFSEDPPGYLSSVPIGELQQNSDRQRALEALQRGTIRLLYGIVPCVLALVDAAIQLLFTLALTVLWVSCGFALLVTLFQQDLSLVVGLLRRAVQISLTSWLVSFVLGLLLAVLLSAAQGGDGVRVLAFTFGGLAAGVWLLRTAVSVTGQTITALFATVGTATGVALSAPALPQRRTASGKPKPTAQTELPPKQGKAARKITLALRPGETAAAMGSAPDRKPDGRATQPDAPGEPLRTHRQPGPARTAPVPRAETQMLAHHQPPATAPHAEPEHPAQPPPLAQPQARRAPSGRPRVAAPVWPPAPERQLHLTSNKEPE